MASASTTSARTLFADSKMRLADRVQVNVNNVASLARQMVRGSKSTEVKVLVVSKREVVMKNVLIKDAHAFRTQFRDARASCRELRIQPEEVAAALRSPGLSAGFPNKVGPANRGS